LIRYITRNEVDSERWNTLIYSVPNGLPYAFTFYLDLVTDKNWHALVLDDYSAVMPLPWRRKAGVNYIYPPYFVQQLGVFSKNDLDEKELSQFVDSIPEKFRFVELNLNINNNFANNNFKSKRKITHHLPLDKAYNFLYKKYNENTRRNLKKAQAANLKIDERISASELIQLFKKEKSKEVKELNRQDYKRLKQLIEYLLQNDHGEIYGVKNRNGEYCAGGFFVKDSRTIINLFPISNEEGRKSASMFLLIDSVIKRYSGSSRVLDFEGSEIAGIARFYKGFGGEEKFFPQLHINRLPKVLKWMKK